MGKARLWMSGVSPWQGEGNHPSLEVPWDLHILSSHHRFAHSMGVTVRMQQASALPRGGPR